MHFVANYSIYIYKRKLFVVVVEDVAICAGGVKFDSRVSQIGHTVANGSPLR